MYYERGYTMSLSNTHFLESSRSKARGKSKKIIFTPKDQEKIAQGFWSKIDRIQYALGWSLDEICDHFSLSFKQIINMRRTAKTPNIIVIKKFADHLNLNIDHFINQRIDYRALSKHMLGKLSLPERYSNNAFSRVETSLPLLNWTEFMYGHSVNNTLLKSLQLSEAVFAQTETSISLLFLKDYCKKLKTAQSVTDDFFLKVGSFGLNCKSAIANQVAQENNITSLYEKYFYNVDQFYEKNFTYKISKLNKDECVIDYKMSKMAQDAFKTKFLKSRELCYIKIGITASIPFYLNLPVTKTEKTACILDGDPVCRMHTFFDKRHYPTISD